MGVSLLSVLLFGVILVCADVANRAHDFQNSCGVNLHTGWDGTCYDANWDNVYSSLVASGIKHYRDGLEDFPTGNKYYQRHSQLGSAGLKGTYVTDWGYSAALISQWPARVNNFEYYEAVNEPNLRGNSNWISDTLTLLEVIASSRNQSFKVICPSITLEDDRLAMGDISAYCDFGNMHDYDISFNPGNPGWGGTDSYGTYGSLSWDINTAKINNPNQPICTTENGWSGTPNPVTHGDVPLIIQAKYILRDYLLHFNSGVHLTHLYQFCDNGANSDGNWGYMDENNVLKPSYYVVSGLLNLIQDTAGNSATFTPKTLNIVLGGSTTNVVRTVLQKADGSFYVVLWIETADWDVNANGYQSNDVGAPITVPPQSVTISFSSGAFTGSYYTFSLTTGQISTSPQTIQFNAGATQTITVNSMPSVLQLVSVPPPTAPPTRKPTLQPTPKPTLKPTAQPTPKPTPKQCTTSQSGTVILANSSSSLTDSLCHVYTLTPSAQIAIDGVVDTNTQKVLMLVYVNGELWQQNVGNIWYGVSNGVWSAATTLNPLLGRTSDPTVEAVYGGSITDASGNVWSITAGKQITVNGVVDTTTQKVLQLAYVQGTIYQVNVIPTWYYKTSSGWSAGSIVSPLGYVGCYTDNGSGVRDLPVQLNGVYTVDTCISACYAHGYAYAGAQWYTQCFCGDSYGSQGKAAGGETDCNIPCTNNAAEICGGGNRNSVYAATSGLNA